MRPGNQILAMSRPTLFSPSSYRNAHTHAHIYRCFHIRRAAEARETSHA